MAGQDVTAALRSGRSGRARDARGRARERATPSLHRNQAKRHAAQKEPERAPCGELHRARQKFADTERRAWGVTQRAGSGGPQPRGHLRWRRGQAGFARSDGGRGCGGRGYPCVSRIACRGRGRRRTCGFRCGQGRRGLNWQRLAGPLPRFGCLRAICLLFPPRGSNRCCLGRFWCRSGARRGIGRRVSRRVACIRRTAKLLDQGRAFIAHVADHLLIRGCQANDRGRLRRARRQARVPEQDRGHRARASGACDLQGLRGEL
jgi:hypothetical protein